jgi:hypothetical protein
VMGNHLKPGAFKLWVKLHSPRLGKPDHHPRLADVLPTCAPLGVAPQVAFERQTLKPVFSLDRL